ncbi:hypothetical protein SAMN05421803_11765 [Nocardiopsis flavescens]|uniref:Uncharacterized protein n=1 Tax=Nocardiopsis flavescens TaxID=758803 RepID=A0A1M6RDT8_9ACTN|nr:hypothetical protein [Nocardiopsis flavescens]SHK30602.1 hypothetical protein SAMN05421803_11765 [Nocardiopsis flavescens]
MSAGTGPATVRHRPTITRHVADLGEGEAWVYRMRCTCGAPDFTSHYQHMASDRRRYHLEVEATVDASERCRDKRHRIPDWDVCALCADQLPLF